MPFSPDPSNFRRVIDEERGWVVTKAIGDIYPPSGELSSIPVKYEKVGTVGY